jgi:hypothetical protein
VAETKPNSAPGARGPAQEEPTLKQIDSTHTRLRIGPGHFSDAGRWHRGAFHHSECWRCSLRRAWRRVTGQSGVSLSELLIATAVAVVVLGGVYIVLHSSLTATKYGAARVESQQAVRAALDTLAIRLRMARNEVDVLAALAAVDQDLDVSAHRDGKLFHLEVSSATARMSTTALARNLLIDTCTDPAQPGVNLCQHRDGIGCWYTPSGQIPSDWSAHGGVACDPKSAN